MVSQLALLTDLYQLSMACGYWHAQVADREAVFHLTFRRAPFAGAYAVAAGLAQALEYLHDLRFSESDCAYLATLLGNDGKPMFATGFLDYLRELEFTCTVDAVPDGRVVFPHQPLLRVRGPIIAAQLVETALLTAMNFHTLIATKASRVVQAARGAPVLEFGLRRAQGFDGGLSASRAAYLGGCAATSNVLAGKLYGIPVRGTHAHSWVMFHGDELESFRAYAAALPSNCTFLVDTFDTIEGVRHAITVGLELRARGYELAGIRLDSGDLAYLSQQARALLDAAGFPNAKVVASNDLDEHIITSLYEQGACIDTFGVGTKLVTAFDQPALGGVYKLGAVREPDRGANEAGPTGGAHERTLEAGPTRGAHERTLEAGPTRGAHERTLEAGPTRPWRYAIKLSEQPIKISNPGQLAIRRLWNGTAMVGDVIFDHDAGCGSTAVGLETDRALVVPTATHHEDIMVRVMTDGVLTVAAADATNLEQARARAAHDLQALSPRHRRFANPEPYWVGLDQTPADTKRRLIAEARDHKGDST